MRVLITGIAGFAGSHLADYLVQQVAPVSTTPLQIHGVVHRHDWRIQHLRDQVTLHQGDLRNAIWVDELIQTVQPDRVFHLAAWSDVGGSWHSPWITYELNIQSQLHLLAALLRQKPDCKTIVVSSNEIYGRIQPDDLPISEKTEFRPSSPYGVSKLTQDMMAFQYWNSHEMPTIRARSFNHIGPRQADSFVASAFARQIAEIEMGKSEPIVRVGNLQAKRDFTDVRDIVRAYWLLSQKGQLGEAYNIGSGIGRPVQAILDTLLSLTSKAVTVEVDPARLRPSDVPESVCDNRQLCSTTGWQPEISFEKTLSDLLDDWRVQLRNS